MNTTAPTATLITTPVPTPAKRGWMARMSSRMGAFGITAALAGGGFAALMPMMCAPAPAPTLQQQVVTLTNEMRAGSGLGPLTADASLTNAAQAHAVEQASVDTMSHTGLDGSNAATRMQRTGYPLQNWGENVAADYASPSAVVYAWMNSPGHRANIVSGNFTQIGIGIAYAADGSPYWAMELAKPF
jgi:uncharacterized protein YkwD